MQKISSIEGIGRTYYKKLADIGVSTFDSLLKRGASKEGRKNIAHKSGIPEKEILRWVHKADLARIKGIGEEYADLLEMAGVDTVPELAQRNADHLHKKMAEVNAQKKMVCQLPAQSKVKDWVNQAKGLDRVVTY